jgi:hypothetical protein
MTPCPICQKNSVRLLLDLDPQPVTNRFLQKSGPEYLHPMRLGQCEACGLLQLIDPVPAEELKPPYEWLTAIEPEGHLDELADALARLPGIVKDAHILGLSEKDSSLLRRMQERGFTNTASVDFAADLGITDPSAGIETLEAQWHSDAAKRVLKRTGAPHLILVRHVLEHCHDINSFLAGLHALALPENATLVFELPGCNKQLNSHDFSMLWEEHQFYFTPETLHGTLTASGFKVADLRIFPYALEDSLVAIVKPQNGGGGAASPQHLVASMSLGLQYAAAFPTQQQRCLERLRAARQKHGSIAIFGAGHAGAVFTNIMALKNEIAFFVDDHPKKNGLLMPGSQLPIKPSSALLEEKIGLCLLCLSPESEKKVVAKNGAFVDNGGHFRSIFPARKEAITA